MYGMNTIVLLSPYTALGAWYIYHVHSAYCRSELCPSTWQEAFYPLSSSSTMTHRELRKHPPADQRHFEPRAQLSSGHQMDLCGVVTHLMLIISS